MEKILDAAPQFTTPEEELIYLREKVAEKERALGSQQETVPKRLFPKR
jgi:hypothetical protein